MNKEINVQVKAQHHLDLTKVQIIKENSDFSYSQHL